MLGLKAKLYGIGAALLAFAALWIRIQYLEGARDKANARALVAEAERDQVKSNDAIRKQTKKERHEQRKIAEQKILEGGVPATLGDDLNDWD